jgi:hypothetical protein
VANVIGGGWFLAQRQITVSIFWPNTQRYPARTSTFSLAYRSVDAACMGHIWDAAQSPQHPRKLLEIGDRYGHQNVR